MLLIRGETERAPKVPPGSLRFLTRDRQTTNHSIVRRAGLYRLYRLLTTRCEAETFRRQYRPQGGDSFRHARGRPGVTILICSRLSEKARKQNPPMAGSLSTPVVSNSTFDRSGGAASCKWLFASRP